MHTFIFECSPTPQYICTVAVLTVSLSPSLPLSLSPSLPLFLSSTLYLVLQYHAPRGMGDQRKINRRNGLVGTNKQLEEREINGGQTNQQVAVRTSIEMGRRLS